LALRTAWYWPVKKLPPPPAFTPGVSLGQYMGKGLDDVLSINWSPDGKDHQWNTTLVFGERNPVIAPMGFEPLTDSLTTTPYSAEFEGEVEFDYDAMNVFLVNPEEDLAMITYQDGGIRADLVNPGHGVLTMPNAYLIPEPKPNGKPPYSAETHKGLFIWKDELGTWHMRATAGGGTARYTGTIRGNAAASWAEAVLFESEDVFSVSADGMEIDFDMQTEGVMEDGIDFIYPEDAGISFELNNNTDEAAALIRIGDVAWPIDRLPLELAR
jgi:hypothetical protein